ncbi:MAG TPA: hypothetical protein VIL89_10405 [Clostridia bacterium]
MTKIHGKSVLLGMGLGIILTALLGCIFFLGYTPDMDEAKIKSLAKKYGMIEPGELAQISVSGRITIEVEEKDTLSQIAKKLRDIGLIKETMQFQLKVLNRKSEDKILPGIYEFTGNEDEQEIINILTGG